jgi:tRNA/rRNA methyltransferase
VSFWTYILRCSDGIYYTGHTDDLERRVAQHQNGAIKGYTYSRRPIQLVWSEAFPTLAEALEAELRVQPWSRAKKEALISGDWGRLSLMAIPPSERKQRASASLGTAPGLRSGRTGEKIATSSTATRDEREGSDIGGAKPLVILVRPQLGENIGKAARAMLNFGLTELRLVAPRDGWPNPSAGPAASGADTVLENAQVFETTAEAVADCANVFATTVRKRGVTKPVFTPEQAAEQVRTLPGRSAILFGAERSGLDTEDVALARAIVTVPINPEFGSLNLAQAVILLAYEWSKGEALVQPPATEALPAAPQAELEGLIEHLEALLEPTGYFLPPERVRATRRTLRGVLTRPGWNSLEIRTLRGVLSALGRR